MDTERAADRPATANGAELPLFPPLRWAGVANALTSVSLAVGTGGILALLGGRPEVAVLCLGVSIPLDLADGWAARRLGEQSPFGGELDSLADIVCFGVLPALLAATSLDLAPAACALAAAWIVAGAWRLAHFNVTVAAPDAPRPAGPIRYTGMPIPMMAAWLVVALAIGRHLPDAPRHVLTLGTLAAGPLLMLSRLRVRKMGPMYAVMTVLLPAAVAAVVWGGR